MDPSEAPKCDVTPATASAYLDPNYWNQRFAQEEHYEWFKDYSHFRHLILQYIKPNSAMKQRLLTKGYKEVKVLEADMLDLPFEDECFDVVIEKGTMDVLFVDSGDPWNPEPVTVSRVMAMLEGVHRVLKPHGTFISITFGQPHFRRRFFNAPAFTWSVEWQTFGDGFHYFFYILKKGERLSDSTEHTLKIEAPSISLFHEELDNEDFLFRTNLDGM